MEAPKCSSCGFTENPINANFCGRCGAKLQIHVDNDLPRNESATLGSSRRGIGTTEIIKNVLANANSNGAKNQHIPRNEPATLGSSRREIGTTEIIKNVLANANSNGAKTKSIGRNDPCPCGSGRKYKNCHGRGIF